jgi:hypothetical protein
VAEREDLVAHVLGARRRLERRDRLVVGVHPPDHDGDGDLIARRRRERLAALLAHLVDAGEVVVLGLRDEHERHRADRPRDGVDDHQRRQLGVRQPWRRAGDDRAAEQVAQPLPAAAGEDHHDEAEGAVVDEPQHGPRRDRARGRRPAVPHQHAEPEQALAERLAPQRLADEEVGQAQRDEEDRERAPDAERDDDRRRPGHEAVEQPRQDALGVELLAVRGLRG